MYPTFITGINPHRPDELLHRSGGTPASISNLVGLGYDITLNGSSSTAVAYYVTGDATGASWTFDTRSGSTHALDVTGSAAHFSKTAAPFPGDQSLISSSGSTSVLEGSGQWPGYPGTDDIVMECVFKFLTAEANPNEALIGARDGSGAGVQIFVGEDDLIYFVHEDVTGAFSHFPTWGSGATGPVSGTTYHIMYCINRDGSGTNDVVLVANGVKQTLSGTVSPAAIAAKNVLATGTQLSLFGSAAGGGNEYQNSWIAQFAYWHKAGWLASGADCSSQIVALAQQRFSVLTSGSNSF